MFKKNEDTLIFKINNLDSFDLIKEDIVLKTEDIDNETAYENEIYDDEYLSYIINKMMIDSTVDDNILIQYASPNILFRYQNVIGLEEKDLEGYVKYNLEEFIPFDIENVIFKPQMTKNQIYLYGINEKVLKFFENLFFDLGYRKVYFTIFISEAISFVQNNNLENIIFLNIEKDYIEYLIFWNKKVERHKIKKVVNKKGLTEEVMEIKIAKLINETIDEINDLVEIDSFDVLLSGDSKLKYIWKHKLLTDHSIEADVPNFKIESYFGD